MKRKSDLLKSYRLVMLVSFLGALFYVFDSFIESYFLHKGTFTDQLLHPESFELWWRLSVFSISLLFGAYAQYLLNRAERYLHISEAMIVAIDNRQRITLINRRGCEMLQRSREELIGKNWFDIAIPEHEREKVDAIYKKIMTDEMEIAEYFENGILAADGKIYYISWHNTLQRSLTGKIKGLLSSGIDITAHKAMEDQLRLAGAVYESTNQGVVVTDRNKHTVTVNPAYTEITGHTSDEMIGKIPSHFKPDHHDEAFHQMLWQEINQTGQWKGEIWDRRKNGEAYPSWQSISSIVNSNGEATHYVSVFSDITTVKQYQDNLDFLAHHDPLTSLPNRLMVYDRIDHALQRCIRESTQLALMFLDLNDFKMINDTHGHIIGDQVLQETANRLKLLFRKEDTIARLGGDEFLILTESYVSQEDVRQVANKIIDSVILPMTIEDQDITIGVSIGIAIGPTDGENSTGLIRTADQAMYRAKGSKCNMYSF